MIFFYTYDGFVSHDRLSSHKILSMRYMLILERRSIKKTLSTVYSEFWCNYFGKSKSMSPVYTMFWLHYFGKSMSPVYTMFWLHYFGIKVKICLLFTQCSDWTILE